MAVGPLPFVGAQKVYSYFYKNIHFVGLGDVFCSIYSWNIPKSCRVAKVLVYMFVTLKVFFAKDGLGLML